MASSSLLLRRQLLATAFPRTFTRLPTTTRHSSTANASATAGPLPTFNENEKTFRAFTREDGLNYLKFRRGYHPKFYEAVLEHHTSTGGQLGRLVDVGTGPGIVVRALAGSFDEAMGLDQSEGVST